VHNPSSIIKRALPTSVALDTPRELLVEVEQLGGRGEALRPGADLLRRCQGQDPAAHHGAPAQHADPAHPPQHKREPEVALAMDSPDGEALASHDTNGEAFSAMVKHSMIDDAWNESTTLNRILAGDLDQRQIIPEGLTHSLAVSLVKC
jgi:hypothetical protein